MPRNGSATATTTDASSQPSSSSTRRLSEPDPLIKFLVLILIVGATSIRYSDFEHESAVFSLLLPLVALLSLIALALWVVAWFHRRGKGQTLESRRAGDVDFPGDGSGGVD